MTSSTTPWQGFDHVAIATPNLEATLHFYCEILDMQAGEIYEARGGKTRHCFIKPGNTLAQGLHFWEVPDAPLPPPIESLEWHQPQTIAAGMFLHMAFALPDETAALALRERLSQYHVQMGEITDLGSLRSMVFLDNNHMMLEAIWPKA
jgi:catechol 2,3-dioxygenase-like lactoylglutathione lyase family enzyme